MAVAAVKREPIRKMFYATMHVTRVEEWCIEAETEEEARELLNNGMVNANTLESASTAMSPP